MPVCGWNWKLGRRQNNGNVKYELSGRVGHTVADRNVLLGIAIGRQGFCAVCRADNEATCEWVVGKRGPRAAWQQDKHVAQKG